VAGLQKRGGNHEIQKRSCFRAKRKRSLDGERHQAGVKISVRGTTIVLSSRKGARERTHSAESDRVGQRRKSRPSFYDPGKQKGRLFSVKREPITERGFTRKKKIKIYESKNFRGQDLGRDLKPTVRGRGRSAGSPQPTVWETRRESPRGERLSKNSRPVKGTGQIPIPHVTQGGDRRRSARLVTADSPQEITLSRLGGCHASRNSHTSRIR